MVEIKISQMKTTVYDCSVIELPRIENRAGNITPVHNRLNLPFDIKRVFYSYDIPGGEARGLMHIRNAISFWWLPAELSKWCWTTV